MGKSSAIIADSVRHGRCAWCTVRVVELLNPGRGFDGTEGD
jgi:hypothetical protein